MKKIHSQSILKKVAFIGASIIVPMSVSASSPTGQDIRLEVPLGVVDSVHSLGEYLRLIYPVLVALGIFLTVGVITVYAALMLLSAGNGSARNKFFERVWAAITSLVVLMSIPFVLANVNPDALDVNPPDIMTLQFSQYDARDAEDTSSCQQQFPSADYGSDGRALACTGLKSLNTAYAYKNLSSTSLQLTIPAATSWDLMAQVFKETFGRKIPVNHAFRGPEYQICLQGSAGADNPAEACGSGASRHTVGIAVDINVSELTQEQYNWLSCGRQTECPYTTDSRGFNKTGPNGYGFRVLNYNPNVTLSFDADGKTDYWITEQHHFNYDVLRKPTICEICPLTSACSICE